MQAGYGAPSAVPVCLIADDSLVVAKGRGRCAESRGWQACLVHNGQNALRALVERASAGLAWDCGVSRRSDAHPVGPRGHPAVPPVGGGPAAQPAAEADQRVLRHWEWAGERCRTASCRPDHGSAAGLRGSGRWRISQADQHDADGGLPGQLGRC